ncbi:MAG: ParB N-terminal domain-containing protein [Alphaproteobacteria bacterium]|nr:ParB N-terminal domain-containing protein [Alphaproteobacteria bacterium]
MEMELKRMKMTDISQHPQNVRIHTKRNLDLLKNSLSTFGLYKPILVQKSTKYIIAGNGTYQAAQALGWE